jgi:branched-chain amino acid aminotransferase
VHRFLLHNNEIRDAREPLISPGQVGFLNGWGVFSTLRVQDGVPFAYERHYQRMKHDAGRLRVPFELSARALYDLLLLLIDANQADNATLRVAVVRNTGGLFESPGQTRAADLVAFTADTRNWGKGVRLTYVANGRYGASPFAGAKITSWAQNLTWYEEAHTRGFDEVILLNEHGQISECTSANIFAIQGDRVWTPPLASSGCLPGVTRAVLLEEIQIPGLTLAESELTPSELERSEQVFITSTTRDLLPVLEIDGEPLSQLPQALNDLRKAFARYRAEYTARHARSRASWLTV